MINQFACEPGGVVERLSHAIDLGWVQLIEGEFIEEHGLEGGPLIQVGLERGNIALVQFGDDGLLQPRGDLRARPREGNAERDLTGERLLLLSDQLNRAGGLLRINRARLDWNDHELCAGESPRREAAGCALQIDKDELAAGPMGVELCQDIALSRVPNDLD